MRKNNKDVGQIILLVIFISIAVVLTFALKKTVDEYSHSRGSEIEEKERPIGDSFFGDLLKRDAASPTTTPSQIEEPSEQNLETRPSSQTTTIKTGSIKGKITAGYYSRSLSGVVVTAVKGEPQKTTTSGTDGWFLITDLPIGDCTLKFSHSEYTIGDYNFTISEGENILPRTPHGFLKNPQPLSISGQTFSDNNGNSSKDSGEEGIKISLSLYAQAGDSWAFNETIYTDDQGNFSFQLSNIGPYKLEPNHITFYNKPNPVEFVVDGYRGSKNYLFPYYPTSSQSGFKIYVFNDKNENGGRDSEEEYIHYQNAEVTNTTTGYSWKTGVGVDGFEQIPSDYGNYTAKLVPQDDSWDYYYKITKKEAFFTVTNTFLLVTVELGAHKLY